MNISLPDLNVRNVRGDIRVALSGDLSYPELPKALISLPLLFLEGEIFHQSNKFKR